MMSSELLKKDNPAQLTEAYHKSRRNAALLSGILIAWEYVGIVVGDGGPIVTGELTGGITITIEHPEVLPVVLVVLVLYFVLRITVEWYQCDIDRRALRSPRIDLISTYILAGGSISLFIFQQALQYRVADFLTPSTSMSLIIGLLIVPILQQVPVLRELANRLSKDDRIKFLINCVIAIILSPPLWSQILPISMSDISDGSMVPVNLLDRLVGTNLVLYYGGIIIFGLSWLLLRNRFKSTSARSNTN